MTRPYHQRLCEECEILNYEYHFLLLCKHLKAWRSKYISLYFWTKLSTCMKKFVKLLSPEHSKTINNLAIIFGNFWTWSVCKSMKKNCRCYTLLYWNGNIILSPRSDTAHIVLYCTILCICTQADGPRCWYEIHHLFPFLWQYSSKNTVQTSRALSSLAIRMISFIQCLLVSDLCNHWSWMTSHDKQTLQIKGW